MITGWIFIAAGLGIAAYYIIRMMCNLTGKDTEPSEYWPDLEDVERNVTVFKVYRHCPGPPVNDPAEQSEDAADTFAPDADGKPTQEYPQHLPRETIREEDHWQSDVFSSTVMLAGLTDEEPSDFEIEELERSMPYTKTAGIQHIVSTAINKYVTDEQEEPLVLVLSESQREELDGYSTGFYQ